MKSRLGYALLLSLLVKPMPQSASGAGVTLATHGLQEGFSAPGWLANMCYAVSARGPDASIYKMVIQPAIPGITGASLNSFTKIGGPDPNASASGEIVILVDWSTGAGLANYTPTLFVAEVILQQLLNPTAVSGLGGPMAELPIHLIGHSRGGSVMAQLARRLGENGIWVDQMTTLDPHPIELDAPVNVFDNVIFADNYWRADGLSRNFTDVDGRSVSGAFDQSLNGIVSATQYLGNTIIAHSLVHAYYHGTIDVSAATDGDSPAAPILDSWFSATRAKGKTGYYFSRLGLGSRQSQTDGLAWWLPVGAGSRTKLTARGQQWPNIMLENVDNLWTNTVSGPAYRFRYTHNDTDSDYTVTFYTDDDANPYNAPPANNTLYTDPQFRTTDGYRARTQTYTLSPSLALNGRYVYAKVADNQGHTRYYYLPQRLVVSAVPPQEPPLPALGSDLSRSDNLRWNDPLPDGDGDSVPEAGEKVRLQIRLSSRGGAALEGVVAILSTTQPSVAITQPRVIYGDLRPEQSSWSGSHFDLSLNFSGTVAVPFRLHVTYTKGGVDYYQDFDFSQTFYPNGTLEPRFEVDHVQWVDNPPYDGNADGIPQSGEGPKVIVHLRNVGTATATQISAQLVPAVPFIEYYEGAVDYPDLTPLSGGGVALPPRNGGSFSRARPLPHWFAGVANADIVVTYGGSKTVQVIRDYPLFDVKKAKWLRVSPQRQEFGTSGTDKNVTNAFSIYNPGSDTLTVSAITSSDPDTTWTGASVPFTLGPGESTTIQTVINTAALQGQISRTITVVSDGRLPVSSSDPMPANQVAITGLVSDAPPIFHLPNTGTLSRGPDVSGNLVAYGNNGNIFVHNLVTGLATNVSNDASRASSAPRISGNIVAWQVFKGQSGIVQDNDVKGMNLANGQIFTVASSSANEKLAGVEGSIVVFTRTDYLFAEAADSGPEIKNLYLYDATSGQTTPLTAFVLNGQNNVRRVSAADVGGGIITWSEETMQFTRGFWNSATGSPRLWKYQIGVDGAPMQIAGTPSEVAANGGQIAWAQSDSNNNGQVWLWNGGVSRQVTTETTGHVSVVPGNGFVAYRKSSPSGIYYWDLNANVERLLTSMNNASDWRADGNVVVWLGTSDAYGVHYAFLNLSDLSLGTNDIVISKNDPQENELVDVSVTVHNITKLDSASDVTVRLYDGDPDAGGTQLGTDRIIAGGVAALSAKAVTFTAVPVGMAGTHNLFARLTSPTADNPANNKAGRVVLVNGVVPTVSLDVVDRFGFETGPKPAILTLRRTGSTIGPLTVQYSLGGTANNGIDYTALPSSVTIQAGASSTNILVMPVDDSLTNGLRTTIITVTPDAAYNVSSPNSATVFIVDNEGRPNQPRFELPQKRNDGEFQFNLTGERGRVYVLDFSTDLKTWTPLITNTMPTDVFPFADDQGVNQVRGYYRLRHP